MNQLNLTHKQLNSLDSLFDLVSERQLKDFGDKVSDTDKTRLEGLVNDLREAIKADDFDKMKQLNEELQQASHTLSTQAYEAAGPQAADNGAGAPSSDDADNDDEDIIDAEFRPSDESESGVGAGK